ncbi:MULTISPECIES: FeoB-associated Cys-rich membrane protein [Loigolactobacillus]|uniref:FeoB-associated Cys-rich membrane protein n=1 Tax=Loigolactobacillus TaxID=2767889 RepID=UPI0009488B22|nr:MULTISPECIES: FeoB-associated Cys-rich membrane protein [Loigolactobacillus]MDA5387680.1 FeoB-associated Cys-rich membrane protein [Loigolactobacillus backii]MDA5390252.1 FeoB-associated Cys-rich membrane protein [Loigolactobacillus backii]PIO82203.1 FeoB-associated Cys-rich membrane protein [Loigolactobacillus backii]PIO86602.1 FeoB-associated Cys-rich membrane protein [Loigolactobacillus backii]
MALFVNLVITAAIVATAGWQIVKVLRKSKQGKCAACDYKCAAKKMMVDAKRRPN